MITTTNFTCILRSTDEAQGGADQRTASREKRQREKRQSASKTPNKNKSKSLQESEYNLIAIKVKNMLYLSIVNVLA